jgi:cytoskeletal protein RodZ
MNSIGVTLRSERLRRGLRLEQVAAETKIRTYLLEAMEDDHFDRLPGGLLTRSFLRQYARTLGLDEDEIIALFKQQFDQPPEPLPAPLPEDRSWYLRHPPELFWVLTLVLASAGTYSLWQGRQRPSPEIVISPVAPRTASRPSADASTRDDALKPKLPSDIVSEGRTVGARPVTVQPSELGMAAENGTQAMHVAFTATEPVWLSIKSDGTETYRGTLEGQQEFGASNRMMVLIGNAGGLGVSLNGRPVGPIGGHGQVRLLVLTPKGASVVPRRPDTSVE